MFYYEIYIIANFERDALNLQWITEKESFFVAYIFYKNIIKMTKIEFFLSKITKMQVKFSLIIHIFRFFRPVDDVNGWFVFRFLPIFKIDDFANCLVTNS